MERKGLELGVGLFLLVGFLSLGYLSFRLGDVQLWGTSDYEVHAKFANVAGLKEKAAVTMAGVTIGQVKDIQLKDGQAFLTLNINKGCCWKKMSLPASRPWVSSGTNMSLSARALQRSISRRAV